MVIDQDLSQIGRVKRDKIASREIYPQKSARRGCSRNSRLSFPRIFTVLSRRIDDEKPARIKTYSHGKRIERFDGVSATLRHYCSCSTLHGLKYIVDPKLRWYERLFWLTFFIASLLVASHVIYFLALEYQEAPISTTIESTNYKISGVPFPAVTVCPVHRVDWGKALDFEKKVLANSSNRESIEIFRSMLTKLSTITFGDFDELVFLKERDIRELAGVNVTEMLLEVMPSCQDVLSTCWWRNSNRDCCDIFELQTTEYGFCYSFNTELAEGGKKGDEYEPRPRRASGYGEWSGVKVTIHLGNVTKPPESVQIGGMVLMINGPRVWPNSGMTTPTGASLSVSLDCISGYATKRVLELDEVRIPCKYEETGAYNQQTCISLCKRAHVIRYCGCNPSFFFPSRIISHVYIPYEIMNHQRDCNVQDFLCLIEYNDLFNDYYILSEQTFIGKGPTMSCDCPPECEYYIYNPRIASVPIYQLDSIMLDVHFAGQTSFRYRTDIVFTKLDLLVSFGSIIGLFLGGSLLSAIELIYYLMVVTYCYFRSSYESRRIRKGIVKRRTPKNSTPTYPILPILDYGPVKPKSWKNPSLFGYGPVKSNPDRY